MGKKRRKIISPSEKAARTKGLFAGRITLKQYQLLFRHGYDGDRIRKWTKHKASKEIQKLFKKSKKEKGIRKEV